ncbi:MAG: DASS family sodium-coupled anion symporter [Corallincola sp.]|nr:DASS family sodium-coupled anion symporter [Corallincola sp.]
MPQATTSTRWSLLLLATLAGAAVWWWLPADDDVRLGLMVLTIAAVLWLTEAIPLTITALLIPVLATLTGLFELTAALAEFANPILYLFLGGFTLAAALHSQQLDQLLASRIIRLAGGRLWLAALLLFATSAALSMWISNTATAAMMLPLALGLTARLDAERERPTLVFVLLGVAYCASIGGIGTVVGSPPNAIAAAQMGMSFLDWLKFGLPVTLILLPIAIGVLYLTLRPRLNHRVELQLSDFEWTRARRLTLLIFGLTVCGWVLSQPLAALLGSIKQFDSLVALMAIVAVAVTGVASWQQIDDNTDWGVLLLFGGGLTLSALLKQSGASSWLALQLASLLANTPAWLMLLVLATFVVFLTELTSNTAVAALLIPLFAPLAESLGLSPLVVTVVIAVAASCAFMLPVATPPNAIVFASGHIRQREMVRAGLVLNIVLSLVIAALAYFVGDILH